MKTKEVLHIQIKDQILDLEFISSTSKEDVNRKERLEAYARKMKGAAKK